MNAGESYINPQCVNFYFHACHGTHHVNQQHNFRKITDDSRNLGDRVHYSGGSLIVDNCNGIVSAGLECFSDGFRLGRSSELNRNGVALNPARRCYLVPPLRKSSTDEIGTPLLDSVANRRFHQPRGGTSAK